MKVFGFGIERISWRRGDGGGFGRRVVGGWGSGSESKNSQGWSRRRWRWREFREAEVVVIFCVFFEAFLILKQRYVWESEEEMRAERGMGSRKSKRIYNS